MLFSNVIAGKVLWMRMKLKTLKVVAGKLPEGIMCKSTDV
jgi:hypothetical protein